MAKAWYYSLLVLGFTVILQLVAVCYHRSSHFQNRSTERWAAASSKALKASSFPSTVSEKGLLCFRAAAFVYLATCFCLLIISKAAKPLIFLSIWNFILVTLLFALATWTSLIKPTDRPSTLRRLSERVLVVLVEVEIPLSLMVSVIYWSILFPGENRFSEVVYFEVSVHLVATLFVLIEFGLNRILLYPERWTWLVAVLTVYQQFAVGYDLIVGSEIYPFLSTQTVQCLPTAMEVGVAGLACHYFACVLSYLKERYGMATTVPAFQTQLYDTLMPDY